MTESEQRGGRDLIKLIAAFTWNVWGQTNIIVALLWPRFEPKISVHKLKPLLLEPTCSVTEKNKACNVRIT